MQFTGERMVPGAAGRNELFFEHVVRYAFAVRHVPGRRVLDAGCGCGYGSQFLSRSGADEVVGVDVDPAAIDYCRRHFDAAGLRFMTADVMALPFADASFDVVTCFEVFEHVDPPDALLAELRRVLRPEGVLVVSTPNALTYAADTDDGSNPFHVREYTPTELKALIGARFEKVEFFVQNPFGGIGIFPMDRPQDAASEVDLQVLSTPQDSLWGEPRTIQAAAEKSAYLIAECGAASSSTEGQLYAMARDLADTTLERRAVDAYVEELTEQYGLLKSEQAVAGEWVEGVRGELADAMRELERLRREHATLERAFEEAAQSRRRLEGYVEELESQRQLERDAKERAEALVVDNRAQQAESKAWAQRVEQDLQTLEEEHRRLSEDRAGLAESLEKSSKWAKQLETELEHTRSRLDAVQAAYGELEAADEGRDAWAKDLSGQLGAAHEELATLRAEIEAKTAHAGSLDRWARDLAQQLEAEKAPRRPEDGEWVEQLKADLRAKTERLEAVEEAHRALSEQHGETSAWARELEASLEETRIGRGEVEKNFTDLEAKFAGLGKSYVGLEDRYGALEKSYADLEAGHVGLEDRYGALEKSYADLEAGHAELERSYVTLEKGYGEVAAGRGDLEESYTELEKSYGALEKSYADLEKSYADLEDHGRSSASRIEALEEELAGARREIERLQAEEAERLHGEHERVAWARSLEKSLVESQAELESIRAAHEELARVDEQRADWARSLERRLQDGSLEDRAEERGEAGTGAVRPPAAGG